MCGAAEHTSRSASAPVWGRRALAVSMQVDVRPWRHTDGVSKQSGREGRRNRSGRQKVRVASTAGQLKIIVATSPTTVDGNVTLAPDISLVRSALLYADTVELVSPAALMVGGVTTLGDVGPAGLTEIITQLSDDALRAQGHDPDRLRAGVGLTNMSRRDRRELLGPVAAREFRQRYEAMLEDQRPGLTDAVTSIYNASGADELEQALERGVLTLGAPSLSEPVRHGGVRRAPERTGERA